MCSSSLEVVPLYWRTEICSDFGDDLGGREARWDVDGFGGVLWRVIEGLGRGRFFEGAFLGGFKAFLRLIHKKGAKGG